MILPGGFGIGCSKQPRDLGSSIDLNVNESHAPTATEGQPQTPHAEEDAASVSNPQESEAAGASAAGPGRIPLDASSGAAVTAPVAKVEAA